MWNIKPEGPADDYGVLVVTRTVYLQQRMELICSVYWIAQTQFVEFISKARRMGVCRPRLWRVSRLKSKELCSKTTPAGSASKELIRRPVPKSMFSPDQTLTHPLVKMKGTGKTWSFFYCFGRVWCEFSHVLAKSSCSVRNADQNVLKRFVHFIITPMKMLNLFPERILMIASQKCKIIIE